MAYDIATGAFVGGDYSMGVTLLWSSAKSDLEDTRSAVDLLNQDISAWYPRSKRGIAEGRFVTAWTTWKDNFFKWYKDAVSRWTKLTPEMPWSVATRAEQKRKELETWRAQFEKLSGEQATGPSAQESRREDKPKDNGGGIWKWLAIIGGAAAGTLIVTNAVAARARA